MHHKIFYLTITNKNSFHFFDLRLSSLRYKRMLHYFSGWCKTSNWSFTNSAKVFWRIFTSILLFFEICFRIGTPHSLIINAYDAFRCLDNSFLSIVLVLKHEYIKLHEFIYSIQRRHYKTIICHLKMEFNFIDCGTQLSFSWYCHPPKMCLIKPPCKMNQQFSFVLSTAVHIYAVIMICSFLCLIKEKF